MVHRDGLGDADAFEYLRRFMLFNPAQASKSLEFIKLPNSRAYVYTYTVGRRLVRAALDRAGLDHADRLAVFRRLLMEPVTPGQLRTMAG
jgi:hypothetical protein